MHGALPDPRVRRERRRLLGADRIFASGIRSELEPGVPDGMKCDSAGNIADRARRVWVYNRSGALSWQGQGAGARLRPTCIGASRIGVPCSCGRRHPFTLRRAHQGRPAARAVHARERVGRWGCGSGSIGGAERASAQGGLLKLDPARCALIIQDMQNDVVMDGGAFAASGSPQHAREQNVIDNIRRLAERAGRAGGATMIHVWFVVEPGAPGVTLERVARSKDWSNS